MEKPASTGKKASRGRRAAALAIAAALLVAAAAGLWYVKVTDPDNPHSLMPPCVFYQLTGLYCSGCGMGRALHYLMNGEFYRAFRMNPLAVASLPFLAGFSTVLVHRLWTNRKLPGMPVWMPWAILAAIVLYTVARNLPWPPFSWLAPVQIN